jgi:predicted NUDIX family phosphoesterase
MKYALCIPKFMFDKVAGLLPGNADATQKVRYPFHEDFAAAWAEEATFRPRDGEHSCERNESLLQIIPYVVVFRHDADLQAQVLTYSRQPEIDEQRLSGKRSIGIGGHIEPIDFGITPLGTEPEIMLAELATFNPDVFWALCRMAALREISEELGITADDDNLQCHTVIYDHTQPVGRVHLGVVCTYYHEHDVHFPNNSELHSARFEPLKSLDKHDAAYENWSQMTIEEIQGWHPAFGLNARQLVSFHKIAFDAIVPAHERMKHFQACRGNALYRLEQMLRAKTFIMDGKVYDITGETLIEKQFKEIL